MNKKGPNRPGMSECPASICNFFRVLRERFLRQIRRNIADAFISINSQSTVHHWIVDNLIMDTTGDSLREEVASRLRHAYEELDEARKELDEARKTLAKENLTPEELQYWMERLNYLEATSLQTPERRNPLGPESYTTHDRLLKQFTEWNQEGPFDDILLFAGADDSVFSLVPSPLFAKFMFGMTTCIQLVDYMYI